MEKKNKVGRPSKYDNHTPEEWAAKIQEYIDSCIDEETPILDQNGNFRSYFTRVNIPTIEGLAIHLELHMDTIYEWAKDKEKKEFSEAIKNVKQEQGKRLINKSLSGQYNSTIAAKLLAANHGIVEKTHQQVEVTTPVPILDLKRKD